MSGDPPDVEHEGAVPPAEGEAPPAASQAPEGLPEPEPPPPVAGSSNEPEPTIVALVFLLPPLALGGTALGLLLAGNFAWNPLGVGLFVGLVVSVIGFGVIRQLFQN